MGFSHHTNPCSMLPVLLVICSCFFLCFTAAIHTIEVNQSIRDPETLISKGQKFKFGFFSPVNSSHRYVGVMFNIPVTTAIWVANRDKPLNDSTGTVEISGDGNLVILDGQKQIVWSSNLSSYVANSTAMLFNTGNLVLRDNSNGRTIWESFEHASDSFVEKMKLSTDLRTDEKNILTSWRSPQDPGLGNFTTTVEPLEIPQSFVWKNGYPYWRSGPWNGQIFLGMPYMKSFYKHGMDVVNDHLGSAYLIFTNLNSSILMYYVLKSSGNLEEKLWSDEKGEWLITWSSIVNECDIYGTCGPFASCNAQDEPICSCFPGYEPKNKDEWNAGTWSSGCTRRTPLRCQKKNPVGKEDVFLKLSQVKLPDHVKWLPAPDADCRSQCLSNCSCIAYAYYAGIGCMTWAGSLIDVQKFSDVGPDLYIRVAHKELSYKQYWKAVTAAIVVLAFVSILLCAHFMRKLFLKFRGEADTGCSEDRIAKHNMHGVKLEALPLFKFGTLSNATKKFDTTNKLGQGGFGPVFKGKLPNGQEIAVKRLARSSNQGLEEFMNEVEVISRLQHRNLVRLLGCCVDHEEKMLVYEYMPNGSLDSYLFDSHKQLLLDWQTRIVVIEGICRGLLYLHRDSRLRIIHRDLKASNILLDEELNPKISDFGMARIFCCKEDQANTTRVVGTYGYMPPEYALRGIFSEKSDVYSFGVLLLEILSGRRNTSFYHEDQQLFLIAYAWKLWNEDKIMNLVDPIIYDPRMEPDVVRYANVGLLCVQEAAADRPNTKTVLSMLSSEIVELPRPKQPPFTAIQMSSESECSQMNPNICSVTNFTVRIVEGR
ncbi:G-type lectin S-receptor-like serine/threonine-protein kinase At1g11300 [Sesamum indicum]|uniref:Receptor-like serine/threonine-protein kinase n=1 Tax=Sesamum indicum TaxID=4182 RepID=A0A6I9TK33_SESIN|nr:G-type lectin S-receptor-like serine/threonine-protein kinase At1g11300 [Sesamum indicum]